MSMYHADQIRSQHITSQKLVNKIFADNACILINKHFIIFIILFILHIM